MLVGDQVATGQRRRDRGHIGGGRGLLEGHVPRDPRGGTDVEVGFEVSHRPRAEHRGVHVTGPGSDGQAGRDPQISCGRIRHLADDRAGCDQVGQASPVEAGPLEQLGVVVDTVDVPVVGHPVGGDRVVRGRHLTREPEVEVVDRLQERRRPGVDVGERLADEEDVGDWVLARQAGRPSGDLDPAHQLAGVVSEHVDRSAGHLSDGAVAAGVHPDDRTHECAAVGIYRDRPRPLRRAPDTDQFDRAGLGHRPT